MSREDEYWRKRAERLERDLVEAERTIGRLGRENSRLCDDVFDLQQKLKAQGEKAA